MFEKKELPKKENDEETQLCEVCGAILQTPEEKTLRRCSRCLQQA